MRYEILLLAHPKITSEEAGLLEQHLKETVSDKKGSFISFERWGKYKLAYPVQKNEYGVYYLVRFEGASGDIQALLSAVRSLVALKYNELIMRYLVNKLHINASLAYQRPDSLEEVPSHKTSSFSDHRVESLDA